MEIRVVDSFRKEVAEGTSKKGGWTMNACLNTHSVSQGVWKFIKSDALRSHLKPFRVIFLGDLSHIYPPIY